MTNWYEASLKDKKNMVFVLEMLKKRQRLTGAKVFASSMETFVHVRMKSIQFNQLILCTW